MSLASGLPSYCIPTPYNGVIASQTRHDYCPQSSMILLYKQRRPATISVVCFPIYTGHGNAFWAHSWIIKQYSLFSNDVPHPKTRG
ncbi:hypothetical protein BV211_28465 [Klebsiella pneumoniae]|nr:hypothetical protein BV211_28465 [Klebsiella pneumoniae]